MSVPQGFMTRNFVFSARSEPQALSQAMSLAGIGGFLIGTFIAILLYGVGAHQTYKYLRSFPRDALYIRMLVYAVTLLETTHVIFTAHTCYYYLDVNYFEPTALEHGVWSLDSISMLTGFIIVASQIFFIRRVWLIGFRQRLVSLGVSVLLTVELVFAIAGTVRLFMPHPQRETVTLFTAAGLGVVVIADTALIMTLVLAIRESRTVEGNRTKSESPLDIVQLYVVNTGLATAVFNLAAFYVGIAFPGTLLFASLSTITTRLYGNTLLAVLNSREARGMEVFADSSSPTTFARVQHEMKLDMWNAPIVQERKPSAISIAVSTDVEGDYC